MLTLYQNSVSLFFDFEKFKVKAKADWGRWKRVYESSILFVTSLNSLQPVGKSQIVRKTVIVFLFWMEKYVSWSYSEKIKCKSWKAGLSAFARSRLSALTTSCLRKVGSSRPWIFFLISQLRALTFPLPASSQFFFHFFFVTTILRSIGCIYTLIVKSLNKFCSWKRKTVGLGTIYIFANYLDHYVSVYVYEVGINWQVEVTL